MVRGVSEMLVRDLGVDVQQEAGSEYGPQERSLDGDCHLEVISMWVVV